MITNTPFYTPNHQKYEKDPVLPLPLTFDRVMEHRPPTSTSALFNLPVEILGVVLEFVESSSLATLALVNSDCRQLARSRQFADVCLGYSKSSEALLCLLASETSERRLNNGSTYMPSLGACIRRLSVSIDEYTLRQRFDLPNSSFNGSVGLGLGLTLTEAEQPEWQRILKAIKENYLPQVQATICSIQALPHLEILNWEEDYNLSQGFYSAIACSSIQHLKLFHPIIDKSFEITSLQPKAWPLRTLHLELTCELWMKETTAALCASILRLCAPSLETLVWIHRGHKDYQTFGDGPIPEFPCLRNLHVKMLQLEDNSIMGAFLNSRLVNLKIVHETDILCQSLGGCGRIPSLEAFSMANPPLDFLKANTQLLMVDFANGGFSQEIIEAQILPILSTFLNLTSLKVSWPKSRSLLPETSLCLIGALHSLKYLCISCGRSKDWRRNWEVDHKAIRRHLSPLRYLQRLALCGDTYRASINSSNFERYYIDTFATADDLGYSGVPLDRVPSDVRRLMLDSQLGKPYWEKRHEEKIMLEAKEYINIFQNLEWIYLGERVIYFEDNGCRMRSGRVVAPFEMAREWSYFSSIFGMS
ncbi:hypothetical protein B0O99DRAFT_643995 [Bisporella sp. PMI_857]|nr:hypothetical protein B0O99DRAFT_643995 [Bisporella sp. PMI_857]